MRFACHINYISPIPNYLTQLLRHKESKMSTPTENILKQRLEELELVVAYAQDIVNDWPQLTMRQLGNMTQKVNTLRQALEAAKK